MIQRTLSIPILLTMNLLSLYILETDMPMIIEIANIFYSIVINIALFMELYATYKESQ